MKKTNLLTLLCSIGLMTGALFVNNNKTNVKADSLTAEDNLVAHYEFKDESNFGLDSSKNHNDLLLYGTDISVGKYGANFGGNGTHLYAQDNINIGGQYHDFSDQVNGDYSVSFWIRYTSSSFNKYVFSTGFGDFDKPDCNGLRTYVGDGSAFSHSGIFWIDGNVANATGASDRTWVFGETGYWQHITYVSKQNEGTIEIYDGNTIANTAYRLNGTGFGNNGGYETVFAIGGRHIGSKAPAYAGWGEDKAASFVGALADFRIYDKALTSNEITSIETESGIVAGLAENNDEPLESFKLRMKSVVNNYKNLEDYDVEEATALQELINKAILDIENASLNNEVKEIVDTFKGNADKISNKDQKDPYIVARYEFQDASNLGKDSVGAFDLKEEVQVHTSSLKKLDGEDGVRFEGNTCLYSPFNFEDALDNYAVSLWVKPDNISAPAYLITTGSYEDTFHIGMYNNCISYSYGPKTGTSDIHSYSGLINTWMHIVLQANKAKGIVQLFVNGALVKSLSGISPDNIGMKNNNRVFTIGGQSDENGTAIDPNTLFHGDVKDVIVFNNVISDSLINKIYDKTAVLTNPANPTINPGQVDTTISSTNSVANIKANLTSNIKATYKGVEYNCEVKYLTNNTGIIRAYIIGCENKALIGRTAELICKTKINLLTSGSGIVKVNGTSNFDDLVFNCGEEVTITLLPNDHYQVSIFKVGGNDVEVVNNVATFIYYGEEINVSFVASRYKVTLNFNYETSEKSLYEYMYGIDFVLPIPAQRSGFNFLGWYESNDFSGEPVEVIPASSFGDKTFYAYWAELIKVTYELDGGYNSKNNKTTLSKGVDYAFEPATKEGYTFKGWYLDKAFTKPVTNAVELTKNCTLYAKFERNSFVVTFKDGNTVLSQSTVYYKDIVVLPTAPKKEGHTFVGWYVDESFETPFANYQGVVSNMTIYAKYEALTENKGCKGSIISTSFIAVSFGLIAALGIMLKKKEN